MRARTAALLTLLTLSSVAACDAGMVNNGHPDAATDGRDVQAQDATTADVATDTIAPVDAAADAGTPDVIARGSVRPEICGNGFDDDGNGLIDDGCDCAVGTSRACWLGPPESRNVGGCHDGVQTCDSHGATATWSFCTGEVLPTREVLANGVDDDCDGTVDEPDGICVPRSNAETGTDCVNGLDDDCDTLTDCNDPGCAGQSRCPPGCASHETVCWGGVDDDCDGHIDCADSDCATDPSCQSSLCPPGQVPTYRERNTGSSWGSSSIAAGDGQPAMPESCEPGSCSVGLVAVVLSGQMPVCVPPPPSCPTGQYPTYVSSGHWRCDPPCELIIHFGSIYGGRTVCAGHPTISCPSGQVPTFMQDTETWQCAPMCNNSLYDQVSLGGAIVCIPC